MAGSQRGRGRADRLGRRLVGVPVGMLLLALAACASPSGRHVGAAEPVGERVLDPAVLRVPAQPSGQLRLAQGVFRVHLSNIRCVRAPCPNGYMVSDVEGQPAALRPDVPQPVSRLPQQVRFDAASGGPIEDGLVDRAHQGDGIVVQGRAWLDDGGQTLRVEVERLLD
ncbi:hypothetical protein ABE488_14210 [Luteimonas sp. TWI662]|uniref:hypothetical protein n=1 Tax=Luteimonas sp. TWI662 TaxID=3136789 RepID=UPI003209BF15